ncbi:hypothetical protein Y880_0286301 [Pseudomonas aeruginosa PAK]|nr:hypothetical protein Y880_0286301 [Pseudomonas aeruginosa PAK]
MREGQAFQAPAALQFDAVAVDRVQLHAVADLAADRVAVRLVALALDDRAGQLGIALDEAALEHQVEVGGRWRGVGVLGAGAEEARQAGRIAADRLVADRRGGDGYRAALQAQPAGRLPGEADAHGDDQGNSQKGRGVPLQPAGRGAGERQYITPGLYRYV